MYKNTKEIQEVFGIDITEKNRTIPYVALRAFYAEDRINQLKGNITSRYKTVAKELGCGRDNVYNLLKKGELFKTDECIKLIFEGFKSKEKGCLEEYEKQLKKTRALSKSLKDNKMFNDGVSYVQKPTEITKFDKSKELMSNLKLAEYLRKNKVFKHDVWGIPVKNISDKQWSQVRDINKNMFDLMLN